MTHSGAVVRILLGLYAVLIFLYTAFILPAAIILLDPAGWLFPFTIFPSGAIVLLWMAMVVGYAQLRQWSTAGIDFRTISSTHPFLDLKHPFLDLNCFKQGVSSRPVLLGLVVAGLIFLLSGWDYFAGHSNKDGHIKQDFSGIVQQLNRLNSQTKF
jgi:hypothetical protein